ncbi:MAG: hypothetical protein RMA76_28815 [Deltaproteobacteria bacterium]|jgi:hypothetical protein
MGSYRRAQNNGDHMRNVEAITLTLLLGCQSVPSKEPNPVTTTTEPTPYDTEALVEALVTEHGEGARPRARTGVKQVAALWRAEDGDLAAFVKSSFIADEAERTKTFARLEATFEQIDGHLYEINREVRRPTDLDVGPLLPVDRLLAQIDPFAHLSEDLFRTKVAFVALLNFPLSTLDERTRDGAEWSRRRWAETRLAGRFSRRVPSEVSQHVAAVDAENDLYISQYNLWMHHVLTKDGARRFPSGQRLISHWNLRDELKSGYADAEHGLAKQRTIVKLMERIVTQSIPAVVIDNPHVDYDPFANQVTVAPKDSVEADAPAGRAEADPTPEPDVRYQRLLAAFESRRRADRYAPTAPTAIRRAFEEGREIPEARVKALFEAVLTSPLVKQVAARIEERLGRPLEPQDLWYDGFKARASIDPAKLDAMTKAKYPNAAAFQNDLVDILTGLGFKAPRASYLADRIVVDASRGAGHAMPALRRQDKPRLRTRIGPDGMDYKGYNIAIHELGHNVEQVFSLYDVDHTLLSGVPNNAFTEALAFVFQNRDLELLGLDVDDAEAEKMRALSAFWSTWEIAGVALVDTAVWHWMYEHPDATPAELREATVQIAKDLWNRHYAPVLGKKDSPLLAVYSHMIAYPLYLPNYPLGHLIAFQIEEQIEKAGDLGGEFERMAKYGSVTPDLWMKNATGHPVQAEPLLRAVERALK